MTPSGCSPQLEYEAVLDTRTALEITGERPVGRPAEWSQMVDEAYTDTHVQWRLMKISGGGDMIPDRRLRRRAMAVEVLTLNSVTQ